MSVPTSHSDPSPADLDQLLSDHLDGWLRGEDRESFEARLKEDAALNARHEAMLADRRSMQSLFADGSTKLPRGFAAGVVAEAMKLRNEVGGQVESPATVAPRPVAASSRARHLRWVAGLFSAAAAVMLVFSLATSMRDADDERSGMRALAQSLPNDSKPADRRPDERKLAEYKRGDGLSSVTPEENAVENIRVADGSSSLRPEMGSAKPEVRKDRIAMSQTDRSQSIRADAMSPGSARPTGVNPLGETVSMDAIGDSFAGAVMVYDVRLTATGRENRVVAEAMKQVGLEDTARQIVGREVVAAAKRVESLDEEEKFQILFLKASAKKLDRLFEVLFFDDASVESAGLALVMDAPILKFTDNITQVDPTQVRSTAAGAAKLHGLDEDELRVLRDLLGDQNFLPMPTGAKGKNSVSPSGTPSDMATGSGQDIMSRVLILVR